MRAVYHNVNFLFKFTSFVLGSKLTIYGLDHFMAFLFVRVQAICLRLFVKALSIAQDFLRRIQISKVNNVWILRNCCINMIGLHTLYVQFTIGLVLFQNIPYKKFEYVSFAIGNG